MRWRIRRPASSLSASMLFAATLALVGAATLIFLGMAVLTQQYPSFLGRIGQHEIALHISKDLRFDSSGKVFAELPAELTQIFDALRTELFYRVVDGHGRVLLSSDLGTSALAPEGAVFDPARADFSLPRGETTLHVLTMPVGPAQHDNHLQIVRSDRFDGAILTIAGSVARKSASAAVVIALAIFGSVVYMATRRMIHQLRRVGEAAARIDPNNLTQRLEVGGVAAEVAPLVRMFNVVLDRLERGFHVQQEFLATAAHELKTPITLMRGQIELDGAADRTMLLKDLDHMARYVQQLLHLAETSEPQNYSIERVDIEQIAQSAVEQLSRPASSREISVEVACPGTAMVAADPGAIQVLIRNLLENAIHHSPTGSRVDVDVSQARMLVRDYGPGIPEKDMPELFKRFWRGRHRRDEGAGLGLAICKQIADRHSWANSARNERAGAEFCVSFGATPSGI